MNTYGIMHEFLGVEVWQNFWLNQWFLIALYILLTPIRRYQAKRDQIQKFYLHSSETKK